MATFSNSYGEHLSDFGNGMIARDLLPFIASIPPWGLGVPIARTEHQRDTPIQAIRAPSRQD